MPIIPSLLNWRDVAKKYEDTPTPPLQTTPAPDSDEFQQWYADVAKQYNLNPDPNDPRHKYDYRAAYDAGVRAPDETGHWPSVHKAPDHPNRYVDGVDTITGQPVRQAELMSADSPMGRATASADASLWSAEGKPPGQEYVPEPTFWDKMKNQIKDQALDAWEMRRGANQAAAKIWDTGVDVSKNLNPLTMPWNIAHGVDKGLEVPIWGGGPSAGDLLGVDIDSSKMPGMETVQAGQDALSNFFKNIVGTKQALAEPGVTGYSDQAAAEEPIWETAGGTEIVPSRRDLAYMVGEYAPEIGATAYGAGPAMKAYATERLAATNLAPALQERFARAAASSAGAFTGGMAKGEPGEAAMNAVLFPTVELGLEGLGQTAGEILKPPAKLAWKGIKSSLRPLAKMGRKAFNKLFVGTDLVGPQREVARSLLAELNLSDDALRILGENRQAGETFRGVVILLENKTITREVALAKTREIAGVAGVGETLAEVAPGVIPVEGVAGKAIRGEAGEVAARGVADLAAPDEAVAEAALAREAADALAPDEVLAREAAGEMAPDEALAREAAEYAAPEEGIEVAGLETLEKLAEERGSFSTKGKKPKKPKPSEISRTAEDFELNPAKMKDLQEGVVAFQSADGKVHKAKIGEDGVFNHADLMTKRGLDPVKDVPGFIDKKGKFVRQYPKAKKNPLQEAAGIRTMEQAERASGTYVEKGAKHLSKAEQKTGENLFKIEAENIAEARGYKHTWEQLTKEATAALDNMEASFDRDTGKLFIKGKEITDKTIVRDTEMEMIRQIKLGFEQKLAKAAIDLQVNPASAEAKTIFDMALTDAAIISNRFYGVRAEAGRLLNSLKKKVAPGDVYERHLVRFIQEASDDAKQVLMKEILKARHEVELNIAKGMRPEEAYAPMRRVIRDFSNASWQQKLVEWVTMAKLTSPTTHARNFISNSVFMAIQPGVKIASALADLPLAAIRKARGKGGREVFAGEAAAEVFGYATAIKQAFREAYVALKTGVYAGTKGQEVQMYRPAIRGVKGEIVRLPGRFLGAGDAFFKPFARNSVLWSEAYRAAAKKGIRPGSGKFVKFLREFVTNPPKETIEKANSEALRRLFQAPLGKYTKTIAKMRGEHPLSRLVILFLNTPINILKEGHRHLPTGFAMPSVRADLKAGGARASEAIGRMAFGSSAAATIGYLAATGAIDCP